MAFKDFPEQQTSVQLLQRSLRRGRLAHGYLFAGTELGKLEELASTLAQTLNCLDPVLEGGVAVDCCDRCLACQRIRHGNHPDVHWVRPESKSRIITVAQMRELMRQIQLRPSEARYKVAVIVAADRLRAEAGNAFLKTLEEPPAQSVLALLTTEPPRVLETIRSRCLRLNFATYGRRELPAPELEWLRAFSDMAGSEQKSLLGRYRLMDVLLRRLSELKTAVDEALTARSPLQTYKEAEKETLEQWEEELKAAIEAEYRRQRADLLDLVQAWLRDVWVLALGLGGGRDPKHEPVHFLSFPQLAGTREVARRISATEATENLQVLDQLQRWLGTNVQEALALEVGLLKLRL